MRSRAACSSGWRNRAALGVAAAFVLMFAAASPAAADTCSSNLTDGGGYTWDVQSGDIGLGWSGALAGGFVADGSNDAYDGWAVLKVGTPALLPYLPPGDLLSVCGREEGGREVTFPWETLGLVDVSRKIYVPDSGTGFAR